jgi:hypothetical protein
MVVDFCVLQAIMEMQWMLQYKNGFGDNVHSEWWMLNENEYSDTRKQHFYECLTVLHINHAKVQLVVYIYTGRYQCLHDIFVNEWFN